MWEEDATWRGASALPSARDVNRARFRGAPLRLPAIRGEALNASINAGIQYGVKAQRKVTVVLPGDLLKKAQLASGQGITPTIRRGLELVAAARAYEAVRQLRGKVRFSIDVESLRKDR